MGSLSKRWGLIQILTIVAIVTVVLALVIPPTQWASDGDIRMPIKIFVFDAVNCRPISDAECLVFASPPATNAKTLTDHFPSNSPISEWPANCRTLTDENGTGVIEYKFATSASHKNPIPRAHLKNAWVRVEASGFGGIVVPVRYEGQLTSVLRKDRQIPMSIGLLPKE